MAENQLWLRCATCGDKTPTGQEHICWVYAKLQEPAVPELCPRCGEPCHGGLSHWRCWEQPGH